jgi:TonB-dependent starch-binding outer membrane protein SusC
VRLHVCFLGILAAAALLIPPDLLAQDRQVTGQVVHAETEQPLVGVLVSVVGVGGYTSAVSAEEGRFTIRVPQGEVRLRLSGFGYTTTEVTVGPTQTNVRIAMTSDVFRLSEVVVTGQATTIDRRSATTAISYVAGDDIQRVPAPSLMNSLQGRVTGVNLQTNSGAPGGGIQMQVRGNATILGGFDPLIVVDGVIYSNASIPSGRGFTNNAASPTMEGDPVNRIADLNPADIQSIEILKGAAASSIYGSKASNGVMVITTNRGRAGETRMNVVQRFGLFTPLRTLDERRWTEAEAVARYGAAAQPFFQDDSSPYFDHYEQVYGNRGLSYETIADVSGGTDRTRYFVSGSWKHDEGIEYGTYASRQGLRINVDQTLSDQMTLNVSSAFVRNANDRGWNNNCNNFGCHGYAFAYIPSFVDLTRRNPDGSFPQPTVGVQSNPVQLTELGVNDEETNRFTGGATLNWEAWASQDQELRFVAGGGVDAFDQRNDVWTPNELFFERPQTLPGESVESGGRSLFFNWNLNAIHTFFGDGWTANTSFGIQYEDRQLHTFRIRTQGLLPGQRNVNQGTNITAVENLEQERTLALYAQEEVRLLDDLLLVQLGLRAERSSVNGDIDKFYVFPKASGSYRFPDLVGDGSEVKLRVAYGETGNQPLFGQKFTNLGTPQLGGLQGITVATTSGAPNVDPERLKEWEAGVDGMALNRRLTWELTGFRRTTTNLLLSRTPAPSSGFTSQVFNGGEIRNQGIEIGLGYAALQSESTTWTTRGTFTRYTSEVIDLAGLPAFFPTGSGFGNLGRTYIQEGRPITQIVGFDLNPDGTRASELKQLGNSAPDFRVGWVNELAMGRLNVNVLVDWQQGGSVINLTRYLTDAAQTSPDWNEPSWEARYQHFLAGSIEPYIEDATFVKLREVAVNYDVPTTLTEGLGLGARSLRVGVVGRNLLMSAKYDGLDPEVSNFGALAVRGNLDISPHPPTRSFFLNIAVGF